MLHYFARTGMGLDKDVAFTDGRFSEPGHLSHISLEAMAYELHVGRISYHKYTGRQLDVCRTVLRKI